MNTNFNEEIIKKIADQILGYVGGDLAMVATGDPEGRIPQVMCCEVVAQHFFDVQKNVTGNTYRFTDEEIDEIKKFQEIPYEERKKIFREVIFPNASY